MSPRTAESRERQRDSRAALADEGGYLGGPVPYGLRLDEWGRWARVRREVDVLRRMAQARAAGLSLNGLAKLLRDVLEAPAPRGGAWTPTTILKVLHNPLYHRRVTDIPQHVVGDARLRAAYNYAATGILADPENEAYRQAILNEMNRRMDYPTND